MSAGPRTLFRTCSFFHVIYTCKGCKKQPQDSFGTVFPLHFNQFWGNNFIIKFTLLKFSTVLLLAWNVLSSLWPAIFCNIPEFPLKFFSPCKRTSSDKWLAVILTQNFCCYIPHAKFSYLLFSGWQHNIAIWFILDIMMNCSFMYLHHLICHLVHHLVGNHAVSALTSAKFISKFVRSPKFWYTYLLFFKFSFSPWNLAQIYLRHLIFFTSILLFKLMSKMASILDFFIFTAYSLTWLISCC